MILCNVNTAGVEIHRASQQVHFYFIAGIAITTETERKNDSAWSIHLQLKISNNKGLYLSSRGAPLIEAGTVTKAILQGKSTRGSCSFYVQVAYHLHNTNNEVKLKNLI